MIFIKVKTGDRVQIVGTKSEEFTVRLTTFWRIHGYDYNYMCQELDLDGFGVIWSQYVTEIL